MTSLATRLATYWSELRRFHFLELVNRAHHIVTLPFSIFFLTYSAKIDPAYKVTQWGRVRLALRFVWNNAHVTSASSYRAHLVIAMKLLELPPSVPGCVVECGCFKGAMSVNLSIVCKIVGRTLEIYDSFEGLPPPTTRDYWPEDIPYVPGLYKGALAEVRANVERFGVLEVCEFHKGWFKDTLPTHSGDIALAVVDVDYESSFYDCVTNLWPHLVDGGFLFVDEYVLVDFCALFYSEKFWSTHFQCAPPGLIGAGSGVQVGEYYLGPWTERWITHCPASIAYTRKGFRALWDYYPSAPEPRSG